MSIQADKGELPDQRTAEYHNIHGPQAQVQNNEGAYVYRVDDMKRLERFILLGCDGVQYYADDENMLEKNLNCIERIINAGRGPDAVDLILRISTTRRNLKQNSLLYAYAMLARCKDQDTKERAYENLNKVCRIPTHLFLFVDYCEKASSKVTGGTGWGNAHRKAIVKWYTSFAHEPLKLARLVSKFRKQYGTSHTDVLRRAHPMENKIPPAIALIIKYIIKDLTTARNCFRQQLDTDRELHQISELLGVYDAAMKASCHEELCSLIRTHQLSHEHCPKPMLRISDVWRALLRHMSEEALIRNLGKMSEMDLFVIGSEEEEIAVNKILSINSPENVRHNENEEMDNEFPWQQGHRRLYVHPFHILKGWLTYKQGSGERSNKRWQPNDRIVMALEEAYYSAFSAVEPTGKHFFLAVHMTGSMTQPALSPYHRARPFDYTHAAATMMMVTCRTEEKVTIKGFSDSLVDLGITQEDTLDQVINKSFALPYEGTDCSKPMYHAVENRIRDVDVFVIFTDNQTISGKAHAAEALRQYREHSGKRDAKLIVCSMAANEFSIADQDDDHMLDMVGFDAAAPQVIYDFVRS